MDKKEQYEKKNMIMINFLYIHISIKFIKNLIFKLIITVKFMDLIYGLR